MNATFLTKLKQSGIARNIPNISEENARYIGKMLAERGAKKILEIGTANGYSALSFLFWIETFQKEQQKHTPHFTPSLPQIITIEYAWNAHNEAVEHFKNRKIKNIVPLWGDAKMVLPAMADGFFDVVYIDAMKKEYLDYLLLAIPKMTPDALIILDDAEKFAHKMTNLYDFLHDNAIPYRLEKTDADDSIMILEKKDIPLHRISPVKMDKN